VAPHAVATVARTAVLQCYGVVGLTRARRGPGLLHRRRRGQPLPGIEVEIAGDGVALTLHIVVEYGVRISEVARNVMNTVAFAVEKALGMPVREVNVHVDGLHVTREP
jgi:uncharacterized alkaline shock family protein YloU